MNCRQRSRVAHRAKMRATRWNKAMKITTYFFVPAFTEFLNQPRILSTYINEHRTR